MPPRDKSPANGSSNGSATASRLGSRHKALAEPGGVAKRCSARSSRPPLCGRVRRVLRRREVSVDQFDAIAIGIGHEADPELLPAARSKRWALGVNSHRGEPLQQGVEIVYRERDVVVAVTEVVPLLAPDVDR